MLASKQTFFILHLAAYFFASNVSDLFSFHNSETLWKYFTSSRKVCNMPLNCHNVCNNAQKLISKTRIVSRSFREKQFFGKDVHVLFCAKYVFRICRRWYLVFATLVKWFMSEGYSQSSCLGILMKHQFRHLTIIKVSTHVHVLLQVRFMSQIQLLIVWLKLTFWIVLMLKNIDKDPPWNYRSSFRLLPVASKTFWPQSQSMFELHLICFMQKHKTY